MSRPQIQAKLAVILKETVGQNVDAEAPLMEAGVDSLAASELVQQLAAEFCVELPATLLFDHPSMSSISSHVASELSVLTPDVCSISAPVQAPRDTRPIPA